MLYLIPNLLVLVGLMGIFYLTGWLVDRPSQRLERLGGLLPAYRFGLGAALGMGLLFLLASVQLLHAEAAT